MKKCTIKNSSICKHIWNVHQQFCLFWEIQCALDQYNKSFSIARSKEKEILTMKHNGLKGKKSNQFFNRINLGNVQRNSIEQYCNLHARCGISCCFACQCRILAFLNSHIHAAVGIFYIRRYCLKTNGVLKLVIQTQRASIEKRSNIEWQKIDQIEFEMTSDY